MRDVNFHRESMATIFGEGADLLKKHYHEVSHYQDIELDPDKPAYFKMEKDGTLIVFGAREEGALIGYAIFFVRYSLHYRNSAQATADVVFIDPTKRGLGLKFLAWCDLQLKELGVQVVYHRVKEAHNWGPALQKFGYEKIESTYGRRLDLPEGG